MSTKEKKKIGRPKKYKDLASEETVSVSIRVPKSKKEEVQNFVNKKVPDFVNGISFVNNYNDKDLKFIKAGTRKIISIMNEVKDTYFREKIMEFMEIVERHLGKAPEGLEKLIKLEMLIKK